MFEVWKVNSIDDQELIEVCQKRSTAEELANVYSHADPTHDYVVAREVVA